MKTFVRLLALIAPYWLPMLLAAGLGFLTVAGGIGLMAAAAFLISAAALHPPVMALMPAVAGVRFFGLTRPVCRYLERYFAHDATFKLLSRLRVWFYTALEPLAPARLMEYRSGELLSRFAADVETLEQFYLRVLAPFLTALLVLLAVAGVFGAWLGPGLALTLLFFLLAAALAAPLAVRALSRGAGRQMLTARAALNVQMVDIIQGITEITAFNREEEQQEQVNLLSRKLLHLQGRLAWGRGLSSALGSLLMNLAMWSLLLLAIPLVRQGRLDGVYLAVLILGALSSFEAVLPLPMALQQLEESLAAARRLFAVTDAAPQVRDLPGPSPAPQNYTLLVKGLRFRYAQDEPWVLDGLDFMLPAGNKLAIVGPSGAGKSTLVNIFLRFWDYRAGSISLGGHELKAFSPDDLRSYISVVTQHTYLFNATIRDNLLIAQPEASAEEVRQAAMEAHIHPFIASLPDGYDTYIGERGFKLSGGQRQRLAIARALLKKAPLLLLDEATAGLDPLTEQEVMASIHQLMEGRTTLVITHRLAGLERMDEILVLEKGQIAERGRHQELLKQNGLYRRMWELQNIF